MGHESRKYVQSAVQNVKEYLAAIPGDQMLVKKSSGPFSGAYKPELDESPELDPTRANFYQSQIGIFRWCVELGRIDIINEVSMLSTYLCLPREGHLEAVFHVFAYLGLHHNARVVFDQYVSLLPWESQSLGICLLLTILLIFVKRLC
jgi:hypothetical protein